MWVWESPPPPPQAGTLVSKSTDHGNDVMVAQYVFLILAHVTFRETIREMDVKSFQCYRKKQINNNFPWCIYFYWPEKWRQIVQNFPVKAQWCLRLMIPLPSSRWRWCSQKPGLVGGGVMGCQYTWFLFPEIPIYLTTKNLYLSYYAKCSIPEILEIKCCILKGKRYPWYCTCITQTSGQAW